MQTSETGLTLIRAFEGKRLTGYLDAVKVPTIGWGHTEMAGGAISYASGEKTTKVLVGQSISELEARRLHERDMMQFEGGVLRLLKRSPRQFEYDAMVALAFNIGLGAFGKSSVLRKFNAGDMQGAADAFLMWNKAGGKALAGLTRRRNAERALFLGDVALASKYAGVTLPGHVARLEHEPVDLPEESGARPDQPGKPAAQSSTVIAASVGAAVTTINGVNDAIKPVQGAVEAGKGLQATITGLFSTPAVLIAVVVVCAAVWIIRERMRHAREGGV